MTKPNTQHNIPQEEASNSNQKSIKAKARGTEKRDPSLPDYDHIVTSCAPKLPISSTEDQQYNNCRKGFPFATDKIENIVKLKLEDDEGRNMLYIKILKTRRISGVT